MKSKFLMLSLLMMSFCPDALTTAQQTIKSEKTIKLYIYPGCPSCKNVIKFLKDKNWHNNVILINANDLENYNNLIQISGKDICPYLVDNVHGVNMGESRKIIDYFKEIFNN